MQYDVFICHASEDKEDFVRPLASMLTLQHIDVWYDEFSLKIGDSLTQKIDEGLARSRYGIVVLSPSFFKKPWAKRELQGLTSREMIEKRDLILPIWHRVDVQDVIRYSPPLADKVAANSNNGINSVVRSLKQIIRSDRSPLEVARERLTSIGVDTPPISDEWWLDVLEYKEFLKYPDINIGTRWLFPLPFQNDDRGHKRGENIASTALQMDWSFEAEALNIGPTTHPKIVHEFIHRWPGLYECARENPEVLALYAPQLTIPGFDSGFEDVFDKLLSDTRRADMIFSYSEHSTVDGKEPLCADIICYRHPSFGNYTPEDLGHWYFGAHDMRYIRSKWDILEGIVWLHSADSDWLPVPLRNTLIAGIFRSGNWIRYSTQESNPFIEALWHGSRAQFRYTATVEKGLRDLVVKALSSLAIKDEQDEITQKIMASELVEEFYKSQERIKRRRNRG